MKLDNAKYSFSEEEIKLVKDFSIKINTTYYSNRNQFDNDKRTTDQIVGKLAEIAIFNLLKDKVKSITYPDFTIYSNDRKSWLSDLKAGKINIHSKAQSLEQSKIFGLSWIFQINDKHIFSQFTDNDYVIFVVIDLVKYDAEIKSIAQVSSLHDEKLFKDPKIKSLVGNKKAIYFDDLKKLNMTL